MKEFDETVINGLDWEEICMIRIGNSSASSKSFYDTVNFDNDSSFKTGNIKAISINAKNLDYQRYPKKCDERDSLRKEIKS